MQMHLRERTLSRTLNLGWRHRATALMLVLAAALAFVGAVVPATIALISVVGLNHDLYLLLVRRHGLIGAAAGIVLHVIHHVVALAAALVAVIGWAATGFERASSGPGPIDADHVVRRA
jgi:hypothetical protein